MASKKQRRVTEIKDKKKKHHMQTVLLSGIVVTVIGLLIFLFVTLFDTIFPPTAGKGGVRKKEKQEYTLFFSESNERYLSAEKRLIAKEANDTEQAKELVKALIEGSKGGKIATFPPKTEVQGVRIRENGTAEVNFNKSFVKDHPGGTASEVATVYSLTDTLVANIPAIKRVRILVEGKEINSIKGHVSTKNAFEFKDMKGPGNK
jgi:hypothetical protein